VTARAELRCHVCDAVAAVVERRGRQVVVTGFLGSTWLSTSTVRHKVSRRDLDRAIAAADVDVLYGLNPELVPAWCPTCAASYCQKHWRLEVAGADDHPGWYEATYGTCPEGHRRVLDD
jgi:hypothetical protein